jgi:hypothetical protein
MTPEEIIAPKTEPRIVNADASYPKPKLIAPTTLGYLCAGASIAPSGRIPFFLPSAKRASVITKLKTLAKSVADTSGVVDAHVFRGIVAPPTARFRAFLKAHPGVVPIANFDVMALVRTQSPADVRESLAYRNLVDAMQSEAKACHQMRARNIRRIGDVDTKTRGGLFLLNHFAVGMRPRPASRTRWRWRRLKARANVTASSTGRAGTRRHSCISQA